MCECICSDSCLSADVEIWLWLLSFYLAFDLLIVYFSDLSVAVFTLALACHCIALIPCLHCSQIVSLHFNLQAC